MAGAMGAMAGAAAAAPMAVNVACPCTRLTQASPSPPAAARRAAIMPPNVAAALPSDAHENESNSLGSCRGDAAAAWDACGWSLCQSCDEWALLVLPYCGPSSGRRSALSFPSGPPTFTPWAWLAGGTPCASPCGVKRPCPPRGSSRWSRHPWGRARGETWQAISPIEGTTPSVAGAH